MRYPARYVVLDLEATCWENETTPERMEIIEIGAVCLTPNSSESDSPDEFASFVRPTASPVLSTFCTQLTSIRQEDVATADTFEQVFPRFVEWIGDKPFELVSWGRYDLDQLRRECKRHALPFPDTFKRHIDLKKRFARARRIAPVGLKAALTLLEIPLTGSHHRALDDAKNTAKIALQVLPGFSR